MPFRHERSYGSDGIRGHFDRLSWLRPSYRNSLVTLGIALIGNLNT